jgi:hypothetical protein
MSTHSAVNKKRRLKRRTNSNVEISAMISYSMLDYRVLQQIMM